MLCVDLRKHETTFRSRSDRAVTLKHVLLKRVRSHLLVQQVGTQPKQRQSFKQISGSDASVATSVTISACFHIWTLLESMSNAWSWPDLCWIPLEMGDTVGIFIMINLLKKPANDTYFEGQAEEGITAFPGVSHFSSHFCHVIIRCLLQKFFFVVFWLFFPPLCCLRNRGICFQCSILKEGRDATWGLCCLGARMSFKNLLQQFSYYVLVFLHL